MTTRLYFTPEVKHSKLYYEGVAAPPMIFGKTLIRDGAGWYFTIDGILVEAVQQSSWMSELDPFIDFVSVRDDVSVPRESGLYKYRTATAEVRLLGVVATTVNAFGSDLHDVLKLVHFIKTGEVRPADSYEDPQGGLTRRALEAEIGKLNSKVDDLAEQVRRSDWWNRIQSFMSKLRFHFENPA